MKKQPNELCGCCGRGTTALEQLTELVILLEKREAEDKEKLQCAVTQLPRPATA